MCSSACNSLFLLLKEAQINHNIIHFRKIPPILHVIELSVRVSEIQKRQPYAVNKNTYQHFKLPRIILLFQFQLQAALCYSPNAILLLSHSSLSRYFVYSFAAHHRPHQHRIAQYTITMDGTVQVDSGNEE